MKQLENKIALITGGNAGIGLATAKLFHSEGATVVITARSNETFEKAQKELGKTFRVIQTDVSKVSEIKNLMTVIKNEFGRLDIAFVNAGISQIRPTAAFDEETYNQLFDTNVKGVFYTVQQAESLLTDGASVILNASSAGEMGFSGGSVYGATKAAVNSLARHWGAEYANRRIRFNSISATIIETGIMSKLGVDAETMKVFDGMAKKNPMGRFGRPDEVANAVLFLASSQSSYINGVNLYIDGGQLAMPPIT